MFNNCEMEQSIFKQWYDGLVNSVDIRPQGSSVKAVIKISHRYSTYKRMLLESPYRVVLDVVSDQYRVDAPSSEPEEAVETPPTAPTDPVDPADDEAFNEELRLYREASQYYEQEQYAESAVLLEQIVRDYPNGVFTQSAQNMLQRARSQLNEAAPEEPETIMTAQVVQVEPQAQRSNSPLDQRISINLQNAPIVDVLRLLSKKGNFDIVADQSVQGSISISLENKTILQVLELILYICGYGYERMNDVVIVASKESLRKRLPEVTVVYEVKYGDPENLKNILENIIGENAKVQADTEARRVVVTASNEEHRRIAQIINEIDQQPYQVTLEAKVVEVSTDALSRFGFEFSSPINVNFTEGGAAGSNRVLDFQAIRRDPIQISATLDALISSGEAKSLANSKISTINNRKATILIGDRVPYTTSDAEGNQSVEFIESGISLEITPRINSDNNITTEIKPVVSYIYGWKGPNSEIPWLKTREASATVRVADGETIVLGGLLNEQEKESLTRVPILGDIPLLGNIFRKTVKDKVSSDLIIIISPRIVSPQVQEERMPDVRQ